jgi:hypothetical protein
MPITPEQTTFRRVQTDDPSSLTVFLSIDGTLADGTPMAGPWQSFTIPLTEAEQAMALAIVGRARMLCAEKANAPTE